ncbi:MAG TPA: membrane-bound O-acyltransferase family protein, partial [Rhodospirillaceae bacterium]|nr:membrane-bound O-acyltransferase family protein [Rhodospirillaceae bacterium]
MLFNSYTFILVFLPIVIGGFYVFSRTGNHRFMVTFLTFSSVVFYGWWNPKYLLLILASILVNFFISRKIQPDRATSRQWLWLGIAFNLGLLGYFKYANFFVDVAASVSGMPWHISGIVLPLAD